MLLSLFRCAAAKVKWGKETFSDIEVDMSEEPMVFKAQLFALTGVQPDRQKVMVKGAVLKVNSFKLKHGLMEQVGHISPTNDLCYVSSNFLVVLIHFPLDGPASWPSLQFERECCRPVHFVGKVVIVQTCLLQKDKLYIQT